MDTSFIGDRPPRRTETPIRFELVRKGMYVRVVETEYIYDGVGFDMRRPWVYPQQTREKLVAQGKVESNTGGVITIKGADGVTTTLKKSEMKRNTSIYEDSPRPKFTPFPHDDYWMKPIVEKTN